MKAKKLISIFFGFSVIASYAQINYDDVAVIINESNNESVQIGQYFAQKRNIPADNIIYIHCSSDELTDSAGFEGIRRQIEEK